MKAPAYVRVEVMNLPALSDEHLSTPGFYLAGTLDDQYKQWNGFSLFESNSATTGYSKRGTYSERAIIGLTKDTSIIKDSSEVDYRMPDRASEIYVELAHKTDTLESVTEDEMLGGKNRFLIGNEIIGAANCELVSSDYEGKKIYKLSLLIRGLKDTFEEMDTHQPFERFVHLDGPGIHFFPHAHSRIDESKYLSFLNVGQAIGEVAPVLFTPRGKTIKPFRPLNIVGTRNGGNDLTVTWERHSRVTTRYLDQGVPYLEEAERYKIYVRESANSDVAVRSAVVTVETGGSRTWTYTSAQQLSDGITPGNSITLEIVQLSSTLNDSGNRSVVTL